MTLAITLVSVLVTAQGLLPGTREGVCLVLGFIGLVSTIVLFTLEVRYSQAWLKLSVWAQCNVEEKLVGEKGGPLFSYRNIEPPWYWRLKASRAPTLLYYSLLAVWIGNIGYYTYCLIAS